MIKKWLVFFILLLIINPSSLFALQELDGEPECPLQINALLPSRGEPVTPVFAYVENLSRGDKLYIGDINVPYNHLENGKISFEIPKIKAGEYPVYLEQRKKGCSSRAVILYATEPSPVISTLIPNRIYYCTPPEERVILLKGDNFSKSTKILFDDFVVGRTFLDKNEIEIKVPQARSGLHHIKAVNPGGTSSLSHNFYIEGNPVIYGVTLGIRYEDHYELVVEGEDFLWGSALLVDGKRIDGGLTYKGCNILIYDRVPKSERPAEISLQVVNPDGLSSNIFFISIP